MPLNSWYSCATKSPCTCQFVPSQPEVYAMPHGNAHVQIGSWAAEDPSVKCKERGPFGNIMYAGLKFVPYGEWRECVIFLADLQGDDINNSISCAKQ